MLTLAVIVLAVATAVLCVVTMNVVGWRRVGLNRGDGQVSVLIPARNEESNLPACLESVIAQPDILEIVVADDNSTDATAEVVREFAARDTRVRLIQPPPLPAGWCGKTHACQKLGEVANGDWMLFLDADARLTGAAVPRMLGECERRELTFLSCWPRLEMRGFVERLLMPLLNFVLLTLYPAPLASRRMQPSLGLAHGACILVRAGEYHAIGGHAAVKAELFEDTRLARIWRAKGHRSLCLDGTGTVSVRMYDSLAGIWGGFRKNLFPAFRGQAGFWAFMLLHAGVFLLPFVLGWMALSGSTVGMLFLASALAVVLTRLLLALRFGHPLWSALLHPLAELFLLLIGFASWLQVVSGKGVDWKGRRYRAAGEGA